MYASDKSPLTLYVFSSKMTKDDLEQKSTQRNIMLLFMHLKKFVEQETGFMQHTNAYHVLFIVEYESI